MAGLGLSILWPRFLVIPLWLVMIVIYYFLSKDEERRMLKGHPDSTDRIWKEQACFCQRRSKDG